MSASDDSLFGLLDNAGVSGDARIMVMLSLSPDIELSKRITSNFNVLCVTMTNGN